MSIIIMILIADVSIGQQIQFSQLTKSFTNCIYKDSDGFIWVGTQDGLLRYNNFNFDVFRYSANDKFSLPNNYIKDIIEDNDQNLWIGTFGGGLVQWDRSLERFYSYPINTSSESINSIALFQDSLLLIGSENGLIKFNIKNKSSENISLIDQSDESKFINDIYISHEQEIFIGTNEGLYEYMNISAERKKLNKDKFIVYCIVGQGHRIYFGTDKGLHIYNKRKDLMEHQLIDNIVTSILLADLDQWYAGTNTGIYHFTENKELKWYSKKDYSENGLQSDLIHCLYNLGDDIIWAGTRQGVFQFSIRAPDFKSLNRQYNNTMCSTIALGMVEDKNNDVWVCSREGLMQIKTTGEIENWETTCHTSNNTKGMNSDYTINISKAANNDLWLAYRNNGFSRLREINKTWVWQNFPKIEAELGGEGVNQVYQDLSGRYWLASRGRGLINFNPEDQTIKIYDEKNGLSHPYIFRIYQNQKNELWLSTANGGLCRFNIEKETFDCKEPNPKDPRSISTSMVLATNKSSKGNLLVCTTDGLNILGENGEFTKINNFDGLPNNVVYAALEDDNGKIWVSTNEGISRLDLSQRVPSVTNYNKSHGLASFEFNQHSFLEHSSGLFLFGGVEGVTVFNPLEIQDHKIIPKIALTDFQLFNKSIPINPEATDEFSLKKSINKIDKINLSYNQNSIAFEFAALGITTAENILYQYKLEGLENDWVNAGLRSYASYPKIPFGDYTFKVRLVDLNKIPLTPEKHVKLHISTPPWKTWWANLLYIFSLFSIMYLYTRFQKARTLAIADARENERDVFRKKLARDFHDEAGNKITRISLITDSITRKSKEETTVSSLSKLQDNIQDLRMGMTDFIWVLDPGKDSLGETLRRFMDFANDTFEYTDIHFKMESIGSDLEHVVMESNVRRHFILIMKEAITNILKHSKADQVIFKYKLTEGIWTFEIIDNGKGFDPNDLKRVNGLNNMKARAEKIDGSLEIIGQKNKGSTVSLKIKI